MHQKIDQMIADPVELRIVMDGQTRTIARQGIANDLGDARARAIAHQQDAVGQQDRFVDIVGDHEHGLIRGRADSHQLVLDHAASERIEGTEGLIEQQHLRFDRKGARDADPLLHAARQLGRFLVLGAGQTNQLDEASAMRFNLGLAPVGPSRSDREGHITEHRHPGHERMPLEDHASLEPRAVDFAAVHEDEAGRGRLEPGQHIEDGGLAATGVADDADELAACNREIDILEDRHGRRA